MYKEIKEDTDGIQEALVKTETYLKTVQPTAQVNPIYTKPYQSYTADSQPKNQNKISSSKAYMKILYNETENRIRYNCQYATLILLNLVNTALLKENA